MPLTIGPIEQHSKGSLRGVSTSVTFDASYATGGESLTPNQLGIGQIVGDVEISASEDGYTFQWDATNEKIKVLASSSIPQLIVDEVVTMTSDVGTLAFPPAYIVSVVEGDLTQVYNIVGAGKVAVDNVSVAVNFLTGQIDNIAADAPATLKVTYFPQRPGTFFSLENLVIDEVIVPLATPVNLAFQAAAIQYVAGDTTPIAFTYETVGDQPGVGTVVVDIDDGGAGTTLDFHATDVASEATVTVTYLKAAGLGNEVAQLGDTERAFTSEGLNWLTGSFSGAPFGDNAIAVPGLGTRGHGEEADDTTALWTWTSFEDTDANIIATANYRTNVQVTDNTVAVTKSTMPFIKIQPDAGGGGLVEVNSSTDLSSVTVTVTAEGR
jgi:hypothetical protein